MNQRLRFICMGTLLACLLVLSSAAKADTIMGTTVTGSMTGLVPPDVTVTTQFTSPAVIGPGVEFSGVISNQFGVSADFTSSGLILSITSGFSNANIESGTSNPILTMTFSDAAFVTPFTLANFSCAPGPNGCTTFPFLGSGLVSNTLVGPTLNLGFKNLVAGQIYTFSDVAPSAVPEPASLALLGTGLLGLVGAVRKTSSTLRKA